MPLNVAQCTRVNDKICATCEYWIGERNLEFKNNMLYAILVGTKLQGRCGGHQNVLMTYSNPANHCKMYKRWHMLP